MISSRKLVIGDEQLVLPRAKPFEEVGIIGASVVAVDGVTFVPESEQIIISREKTYVCVK